MNILLWILQVLLALWEAVGGVYVVNNYDKIANGWALNALPKSFWIAIGVLQVLFALGLILPGAKLRKQNSIAAVGLALLSLLGIALYFQYSGFPGILWGLIPAILAGFVAYKRWPRLSPLTKEGALLS